MSQHAQTTVQAQQKHGTMPIPNSVLQRAAISPTIAPAHSGILQRCSGGVECAECRQKRERLQRAAVNSTPVNGVPPVVHDVLNSSGQPLDVGTRAFMEPRFGHDFSQVRIHADGRAAESARSVNALAYTVGRNVVFGTGQYAPGTSEGRRLMAHELTHVVQQQEILSKNALQGKLVIGQPDDVYEQQAEAQAARVVGGQSTGLLQAPGLASNTRLQRQIDEEQILKDSGCAPSASKPSGPLSSQVQFNFDSADVAPGKATVASFVASAGGGSALKKVRVDGYASTEGDPGYNVMLSCRRAKAVKHELATAYGISEGAIEVFAHGPTSQFSNKSLAANRLVLITATAGSTPPGPEPTPPGPSPTPPVPPAASVVFSELPSEKFAGYDDSLTPNFLFVPAAGRRNAQVTVTPTAARPSFISLNTAVATVTTTPNGIVVTGVANGTTEIQAKEGATILSRITIRVKSRRDSTVDYHFMSDSGRPPHKTIRATSQAPTLTALLNRIWERQANVRFSTGTTDSPKVARDLGPQVVWNADPALDEWHLVTAFRTGGNYNVFLVWEFEQDATPAVDDTNGGTIGSDTLLEDNECADGLTLAHEAGHFMGPGHQANGIMSACGGGERDRVRKRESDLANP